MKKIITILFFNCIFLNFTFSIELRTKTVINSIEYNPIACFGVLDLFYDKLNNLVIVFERQSNRKSVFSIKDDSFIESIEYEEIKYKSGEYHSYVKNGIIYSLKDDYKVFFSSVEIDFYNDFRQTEFGDNPAPYYMYIMDKNENVIFNFNTWRLDKQVFYPKTYYTSLSEEKEYTAEQQLKILKLNPASTEWKNHTAINKKQNRIAVVFDKLDGKRGGLVIFEVLYDAVCNDDKVRVRKEPNLNCDTVTFINKNDSVKIKDQSDRKFEIDGEEWYWHEVELPDGKTGWVYGKYLDIEK